MARGMAPQTLDRRDFCQPNTSPLTAKRKIPKAPARRNGPSLARRLRRCSGGVGREVGGGEWFGSKRFGALRGAKTLKLRKAVLHSLAIERAEVTFGA